MKGYTEIESPRVLGEHYVYNKAYSKGDLRIWITRDLWQTNHLRWHMSISCANRYPVWDEIKDAWYALKPPECENVTVGLLLPPQSEYVNVHPNCFHLHEIIE